MSMLSPLSVKSYGESHVLEGGGGKEIERRGGCVVEMSQLKIMPIIIIVSCFERLSMHSYTLKPCLHSSLAPFCLTHPLCLPHLG